jgi:hypothetical protein
MQLPGTDMLVEDEYEKYNNDRQDVVDISADEIAEDVEAAPMANDCMSTPGDQSSPPSSPDLPQR